MEGRERGFNLNDSAVDSRVWEKPETWAVQATTKAPLQCWPPRRAGGFTAQGQKVSQRGKDQNAAERSDGETQLRDGSDGETRNKDHTEDLLEKLKFRIWKGPEAGENRPKKSKNRKSYWYLDLKKGRNQKGIFSGGITFKWS